MFLASLTYLDLTSWMVGLLIILAVFYIRSYRPKNVPPSPGLALPIIGHLYLLEKNPRKQLQQWAEKYGDVFTLQMGPQITVFVNTFEAMKEAFVKKADYFSDRPNIDYFANYFPTLIKGIVLSYGPDWKVQRNTSVAILKKLGLGKTILAEKIIEEVSYFSKELASKNGQPSDIRNITNMSVSNVMSSILFGKRFSLEDEQLKRQMERLTEIMQAVSGLTIINFITLLYYLTLGLFKSKQVLNKMAELFAYNTSMVKEIQQNCDPENLDNYILAYIDEMKKEKDGHTSYLNEINLTRNIDSLFLAGSETTSTTILWFLFTQ